MKIVALAMLLAASLLGGDPFGKGSAHYGEHYGPPLSTPEPQTLALIGGGLLALVAVARGRRK